MTEILKNLTQKQKIIIVTGIFIIMTISFIVIYKYFYKTNDTEVIETNSMINEDSGETQIEKGGIIGNKKKIIVDVTGEVNEPGIVTLTEGARIIDTINAAGGKTEEADTSKINLAYVLEDGVQLYIPRINEQINKQSDANENNQIELIRDDAGEGIITQSVTQENLQNINAKVNINSANKEKLETLPGIGDSTAEKIIEYREKNGKFETEEDIKKVSGIGDSKYNNLKDKITVK